MPNHDFSTLDDVETDGKRVFLRVDINVPLDPTTHQILDDTRIKAVSETLAELEDARVVLGSHQSRPGKDDFTSLEPHARALAEYCNQDVRFVDDVIGPQARQRMAKVERGQVLVLDNLRFCAEENIDDKPEKLVKTHFVRQLAPMFDLNVNDAFATAHRSQPSIVGLTDVLPSVAGRLMEKELRAISGLLQEPHRPCIYVLGGAKVDDKIPVIENILSRDKADKILLGGVPAKVFLKAMNKKLSTQDEEDLAGLTKNIDIAKSLVEKFKDRIETPLDLAYADGHGKRINRDFESTLPKESALDVGTETADKYSKTVEAAATVVSNGPLGVFERTGFDLGTRRVLESMAKCNGYTIIGGGHLIGLASILGIDQKFKHVSTAGGAMLSLLSGQNLPGVDALVRAASRMRSQKDNG
ncbi:MAG TPA: phosphoglycerate kinase [Candidatus Dormibacteraeota bacterium]|nr:phosphoglycerate kinase [Candidatus Dormibacteraeota bacterium]